MMKLAENQIPRRGTISFLFQSERDALDFISRNRLDESRTKNYFKMGLKVTICTNCCTDLMNLYHQLKDSIVMMIETDYYKLAATANIA